MQRQRLSAAVALAFISSIPAAALADAPRVTWSTPASNAVLSNTISGSACAASATASVGVSRVTFWMGNYQINNDYSSPFNCSLDTRKLRDGTYQMRVEAVSSRGEMTRVTRNVTIRNSGGSTTPPPTTTPTTPPPTTTPTTPPTSDGGGGGSTALPAPTSGSLSAWFKAPLEGQTISGSIALDKCYIKGTGISRVQFYLDNTALNTDSNVGDGMSCVLDTTKFPNGAHQLRAMAYDSSGKSYNERINVNIQNSATTPTTPPPTTPTQPAPTEPTTPPASSLPNGGSAVATFHSLGLYWKPTSTPGAEGCKVQYRKRTEGTWKQGLNMWYDSRNAECRGSLVQLDPATEYEVQFGVGSKFTQKTIATTWSEQFPIAKTVTLPAGTVSQPVSITEGGSASGYVLYQAHPNGTTIDVANAYDANVSISAPYVILRGVTMKNARINGVDLKSGAHHVVIENNDISGWGRSRGTAGGKTVGVDMDSGIRAACTKGSSINTAMNTFVIQRNKIRNPRYTANSWTYGHPAGPQAITLSYCGGNHVIRYNDMANTNGNKFNDAIGGEDNFTQSGAPVADSDIYGNLIVGAWDDGIESEGSNKNVRIWGNYIDDTAIGIASTVTHHGPIYIFRNVYNRSRKLEGSADSDDRGPFFKAGSGGSNAGNGRRYVFHNTSLQPSVGATNPGGAGMGISGNTNEPLTNTVTRNNVFHVWKTNWLSIRQTTQGFGNDVDYDLYNGTLEAPTGAESNGAKGVPVYASGHGSGSTGKYNLAPNSPGFGKAQKLNNFNDDVSAPDMGAHQSGKPAMKFGIQ